MLYRSRKKYLKRLKTPKRSTPQLIGSLAQNKHPCKVQYLSLASWMTMITVGISSRLAHSVTDDLSGQWISFVLDANFESFQDLFQFDMSEMDRRSDFMTIQNAVHDFISASYIVKTIKSRVESQLLKAPQNSSGNKQKHRAHVTLLIFSNLFAFSALKIAF